MHLTVTGLKGDDGLDGDSPGAAGTQGKAGGVAEAVITASPNLLNVAVATGGAGGRGGSGANGTTDGVGVSNGPGGDGGDGGRGGIARATAQTTFVSPHESSASASATGGVGGDFGRAGSGAPRGHTGTGGAGGKAVADALDTGASSLAEAVASAVGGLGGGAMGSRGTAGAGGEAKAAAHAESSLAGAEVWATATQTGGDGGRGLAGADAGDGADSTMTTAVTASAIEGTVHLSQTAIGGSGGTTAAKDSLDRPIRSGRGGRAGNATSDLTADNSGDILFGASIARGGVGGVGNAGASGRSGGAATATADLTGGPSVDGSAEAYGGAGALMAADATGGAGGTAVAQVEVHSRGVSTGSALALGGAGAAGAGKGFSGGMGGVATAAASARGVTEATATATGTGGAGGAGSLGAGGGAGGNIRMVDAVSGSTRNGTLTLAQIAVGGAGGEAQDDGDEANTAAGGRAGSAVSNLTWDDATAASFSALVDATVESRGGAGATGARAGFGSTGGAAGSRITLTAARAHGVAKATGGDGGFSWQPGQNGGGAATAKATVTSTADQAPANAEAYAYGGNGGLVWWGDYAEAPDDQGGAATATAVSTGWAATSLAVAHGGTAGSSSLNSGGKGGFATASATSTGWTANARAEAFGGTGASYTDGGSASASARAIGLGSGDSYATANAYGGPENRQNYMAFGSGADIKLIDAVSGMTDGGAIHLAQNAFGGNAFVGPRRGDAISWLTFDDTQNPTQSTLVDATVRAEGGGGERFEGDGGDASARVKAIGARDVTASSTAVGTAAGVYTLYTSYSGDATATTIVVAQGVAHAAADAQAGVSNSRWGAADARVDVTGASGDFSAKAAGGRDGGRLVRSVTASVSGAVNGRSVGVAKANPGATLPAFTTTPQVIAVLAGGPPAKGYGGLMAANSNLAAAFGATPVIFGLAELGGRHSTGGTGSSQTVISEVDMTLDLTRVKVRQDLVFGFAHAAVSGPLRVTGLSVDIYAGDVDLLHRAFTTGAAAQGFFTDNAIDLGSLAAGAGPLGGDVLALRVVVSVTTSAEGGGFYGEVIFGNAPPAPATSTAPPAHRFVEAMAGFGAHGGGAIFTPTAAERHGAQVSLLAHRAMAHA